MIKADTEGMDAEKLLEKSPETGYIEVRIGNGELRMTVSGDAKRLLEDLKENGVEYEKPKMEWCG